MPPELLISRQDVPVEPPLALIGEIATIAVVATLAAYFLGLRGLDMLLAVFFSTTLTGQFLTAFLNKMRPR